ncbi:MAG: tRNA uridine-5-carboxymethylaminomethyl(34) synthesis GTPase MnmE [Candidatus Brocadiia bacterium]|jgi:tRNA modification GTPase
MRHIHAGDTIVAVSSAAGPSARGIVRMSGPGALRFLSRILAAPGAPPKRNYRAFSARLDLDGTPLPARIYVMRAPTSYTREDIVELHTFGNPALQRGLLDRLTSLGARPAEAGEFTRRAFLNGRIDLAQAESVEALIHARSQAEYRAALDVLGGGLSRRIRAIRTRVVELSAAVETSLDFSDHDVPGISHEEIAKRLAPLCDEIGHLIAAGGEGRLSPSFARAVLFGPPNAGKSSLFNAMLRRRRAIVSPHPGTTRDAVEATMGLRSLELLLVDTAGLRPTGDGLEGAAVAKSRHSVRRADLALCVLDAAQPPGAETRESLESLPPGRGMIVLNKCDLGPCHPGLTEILPPGVERTVISAATGTGVKELLELIRKRVESGRVDRSAGELMVSARQAHLLGRALGALKHLLGEGPDQALDLVACDLADALASLSELTGDAVTEDVLDRIFSTFCIGK